MASPILTNTSAQLNGGSMVVGFTTVLTDAQIKALPTTPITLVAAPGVGKRIKVIGGTAILKNGSGAYTNINTTYCALQIDVASTNWVCGPIAVNDSTLATPLTKVTDLLGGTHEICVDLPGNWLPMDAGASSGVQEWLVPPVDTALSAVDNAAVRISADNNGSGVFTGGNVLNSLSVTLYIAYEAT